MPCPNLLKYDSALILIIYSGLRQALYLIWLFLWLEQRLLVQMLLFTCFDTLVQHDFEHWFTFHLPRSNDRGNIVGPVCLIIFLDICPFCLLSNLTFPIMTYKLISERDRDFISSLHTLWRKHFQTTILWHLSWPFIQNITFRLICSVVRAYNFFVFKIGWNCNFIALLHHVPFGFNLF